MELNEKLALYGGVPCNHSNSCLSFEWPCYTQQDEKYVISTLQNKEYSYNQNAHMINQLEENFKQYIGSKYCLALNSGTSALFVAFWALGLQPGDEVLVPTYTFPATVMPLFQLGVKMVFVDCERASSEISIEDLECKITANTKAVVVSHMDGIANDVKRICQICERYQVPVVEDCSQSLGSKLYGKHVGTWGTFGIFSFQQKKIVAAGEGGMLVTNNRKLYEKCILFSYLQKRSYEEVLNSELSIYSNTGLGHNFRMHPLIASMVITQLNHIEHNITKRKRTFQKLVDRLEKYDCLWFPQADKPNDACSYYTFRVVYYKEKLRGLPLELFIKAINAEGIPVYRSTTLPLHLEPIFNEKNASDFFGIYCFQNHNMFVKTGLDNSIVYSQSVFRMAPYSWLSDEMIDVIEKAFDKVINYFSYCEKSW